MPPSPPRQQARPIASALLGASIEQRVRLYRQMQGQLHAGIPLAMSLHHVSRQIALHLRPLLRHLAEHVQNGARLSQAMAQYPNIFPEWEVSTLEAAERAGTLPEAMRDIAEALEMEMKLRYEVRSSTYHLKATAIVAIFVFLFLTVPGRGGYGIEGVLQKLTTAFWGTVITLVVVSIIRYLWCAWGRTRAGATWTYRLTSRLPLLGPVVQNSMRLRFARVLCTLWHAGVMPLAALEIAARATVNARVIEGIAARMASVSHGTPISDAIAAIGLYQPEMLYLIQSGETSGSMTDALERIVEYTQLELDGQAKRLPIQVQLLFYAILGIPVLYLVFRFYLARGQAILDVM